LQFEMPIIFQCTDTNWVTGRLPTFENLTPAIVGDSFLEELYGTRPNLE